MAKLSLTPENVEEWKKELDKQMSELGADNFSNCKKDSEWISDYEGYPPEEAVSDEVECWDEMSATDFQCSGDN